ncbi:hypothetical protein BDN72DRAFT_902783 [Pluteus cervinus]|uniref:Uncharacterized protein n=1 Tax=Pluteus cervinus TaxID=181527 RepID=A0ACD3ABD7_9AGAR|nr:hypothetical protein BDN72DRAFT_902783 [Pluteus cervinus]
MKFATSFAVLALALGAYAQSSSADASDAVSSSAASAPASDASSSASAPAPDATSNSTVSSSIAASGSANVTGSHAPAPTNGTHPSNAFANAVGVEGVFAAVIAGAAAALL